MKKLFISLPMNGRDIDDIQSDMEELKEIAEKNCDESFELLKTFQHDEPSGDINTEACWYLGKSISMLAEADMVLFHPEWKTARGCLMEHMICALYDIPYIELQMPEIDLDNAEVIVDYTHDLDEQPIEIVDPIDISHDDTLSGNEELYDPDLDELEPGEYNADL